MKAYAIYNLFINIWYHKNRLASWYPQLKYHKNGLSSGPENQPRNTTQSIWRNVMDILSSRPRVSHRKSYTELQRNISFYFQRVKTHVINSCVYISLPVIY